MTTPRLDDLRQRDRADMAAAEANGPPHEAAAARLSMAIHEPCMQWIIDERRRTTPPAAIAHGFAVTLANELANVVGNLVGWRSEEQFRGMLAHLLANSARGALHIRDLALAGELEIVPTKLDDGVQQDLTLHEIAEHGLP